MPTTEL